jgi:hypothetical protein
VPRPAHDDPCKLETRLSSAPRNLTLPHRDRRQQLKWLAFGAALSVAWLTAMFFLNIPIVGIAALPVSMGIAILKYRL